MALTARQSAGLLVVVVSVGFAPSFFFWRSNQGLIRTATRLQTARLYDILRNEGGGSPKLKTFVASKIIDQLVEADKVSGRVLAYNIEDVSVQMSGTPSIATVICVRTNGKSVDDCSVNVIEPKALVWMWNTKIVKN